jgi:hypothetical protein
MDSGLLTIFLYSRRNAPTDCVEKVLSIYRFSDWVSDRQTGTVSPCLIAKVLS